MSGGVHWASLLAKEGKRKHYDKSYHKKKRGKHLKSIENKLEIKTGKFCKGAHSCLLENSEKL